MRTTPMIMIPSLLLVVSALFFVPRRQQVSLQIGMTTEENNDNKKQYSLTMTTMTENGYSSSNNNSFRIAFVGNSILYFNDCPRVVERLLLQTHSKENVHQDSCLRGGATLTTLWKNGNGMRNKFQTPNAAVWNDDNTEVLYHDIGAPTVEQLLLLETTKSNWNFVVMNDHTQHPARIETREESKRALVEYYAAALLKQQQPHPTIILLQTAAYKHAGIRHTSDLGDFESFADKVKEGYEEYAQVFTAQSLTVRMAPVGEAFRYLYRQKQQQQDNENGTEENAQQSILSTLFDKLYHTDDFHFSPLGTWLEACVLYATITHQPPPHYDPSIWNTCRVMQPHDEEPLARPTPDEAEALRRVACHVCGINIEPELSPSSSP